MKRRWRILGPQTSTIEHAETAEEALEVMARSAGYATHAEGCAATGSDPAAFQVEPLDTDETAIEATLAELLAENDAAEILAELAMGEQVRVRTFTEAGLLTTNRGLVIEVGERAFQMSIVRSR